MIHVRFTIFVSLGLILCGFITFSLGEESIAVDKPIKIGLIDTYSGRATVFTHPALIGWKMVVNDINARGGLNGRKIELTTFDDQFNPVKAVEGAKELVNIRKVDFLAGITNGECALAVSQFAKENKKLLIVHMARSPRITRQKGHPYVFNAVGTSDTIGSSGGRYAYLLGYTKWYVVGEETEFGHDIGKYFWKELKRLNPKVKKVGEVWVNPKQKDYSEHIKEIIKKKPTAAFVGLGTTCMIPFTKQAKAAGLFSHTRVMLSGMADPVFPFVLKGDMPTHNAYGSGGFLWYWPRTEAVKSFVVKYNETFEKEFGRKPLPPGFAAHDAYTAAKFLTEAIHKAKSTETEQVIKALEGLTVETTTGPVTMRACDHQAAGRINWGKIQNIKGLPVPGLILPQHLPLSEFLPSCQEVLRLREGT